MTVRLATLADVPAIARVHVESWRATYRGLLPDTFLTGLTAAGREPQWQQAVAASGQRGCVFVAVATNGEVVGFASGGPSTVPDFANELYTVYLLPEYQRQGLGLALFRAVAGWFAGQGERALFLWVLAENWPARRFYEALGGRAVREQPIRIAGAELLEVGYCWDDTTALLTTP